MLLPAAEIRNTHLSITNMWIHHMFQNSNVTIARQEISTNWSSIYIYYLVLLELQDLAWH